MTSRHLMRAFVLASVVATFSSVTVAPAEQQPSATDVTFSKDVLPILQASCQGCHRPGEIAPMSFLNFRDVRPWARSIKEAVITRAMPPWFAEPGHSEFRNDPTLSDEDIRTLVAWADTGATEGDRDDAPAPREFADGWNIVPDMIIEMPRPLHVPAEGTINYQNVLVKVDFPEDAWVVAAEMRAGNREVVHHMRANVRPPDSLFMRDAIPGVAYENGHQILGEFDPLVDLLGKYNPALGPQDFSIFDSAKFVPKGSDIIFNLHYTASGEATTDRSKLGLVFAKEPPKKRFFMNN